MGRPARADIASTRHVGFRLTQEEEARLDELVLEQGHRDRSALLRAWLEQAGPSTRRSSTSSHVVKTPSPRTNQRQTSRKARAASPVAKSLVEPIPPRRRHPRIIATTRAMDSSPPRDESPKSIMRELLTALHRHRDPHVGLIRVADVVRAMLSHAPLEAIHEGLLTLAKHGTIELRPDGGTEFLKADDVKVCPRGPRDTVFAYARWLDAR